MFLDVADAVGFSVGAAELGFFGEMGDDAHDRAGFGVEAEGGVELERQRAGLEVGVVEKDERPRTLPMGVAVNFIAEGIASDQPAILEKCGVLLRITLDPGEELQVVVREV